MTPEEIRFIREVFSFSQRELSKTLAVAANTVNRWEQGASIKGIHVEVLSALHRAAKEVAGDDMRIRILRGKISMGIGALLYYELNPSQRR